MNRDVSDLNCRRFPLGGLWTNGYLFFDDEGSAFFVDPGGDVEEVLEYMKQRRLTLKAVLLTHGHLDHIAGIEKFVPMVKGEIYISPEDAPLLRHPPEEMQRVLGMECSGVDAFKTVTEGDVFSIGKLKIKVMATPGHTQGSVCYLISRGEKNILASGDTLFAQSVGRTDLPGGDYGTLLTSLGKLAALPDDLPVFPGHGPDTTIGQERRSNPFWP
ncbi:MAG: MBL fold metallo-hydrolase [Synergistaceae bacterium]|nr:MBL fold metallo-hydrolase [Synergistaceae bacterium]